jgi:hypothetical protein
VLYGGIGNSLCVLEGVGLRIGVKSRAQDTTRGWKLGCCGKMKSLFGTWERSPPGGEGSGC